VSHAIEKAPTDRFQSARDFAFALRPIAEGTASTPSGGASVATLPAARRMAGRERLAWAAVALLAIVAAAAVWWPRPSGGSASGASVVFSPTIPLRDGFLSSPAVSPDGTHIAFIANDHSGGSIVVRHVGAIQAQAVRNSTGVRSGMFWSPDGKALGFFAGGKLKIADLASGKVTDVADAPEGFGGTWGAGGTILFSPDQRGPIYRVNATGGAAAAVTKLDASRQEEAHRWPQFLPDGRHFVFMAWRLGSVVRTTHLASLDSVSPKAIFESNSAAIVAGSSYVYVNDRPSRLMAQPFNAQSFEPEGPAVPVVDDDNVDFTWQSGDPIVSGSADVLVYTTGKFRIRQLTWFDRSGRTLTTLGEPDAYYDPAISPDGATLVVEKRDADRGSTDLWTVDLARGAWSRLTSTSGFETAAMWSHDGRQVAFGNDANANDEEPAVNLVNVNSGGVTKLLNGRFFVTDWSRDGKSLLLMTDGGATRYDILVFDAASRTSRPLVATPFSEGRARFSPDGKWIAYESDESHAAQVYVRSFPDGGTKVQVSTAGGHTPQWRRDGKELFYIGPDSMLMSVEVNQGMTLSVKAPEPLFITNTYSPFAIRNTYVPSPDGQRILITAPPARQDVSPLVGVLNWAAALARK
jgi:Tol biopolymer transport system component